MSDEAKRIAKGIVIMGEASYVGRRHNAFAVASLQPSFAPRPTLTFRGLILHGARMFALAASRERVIVHFRLCIEVSGGCIYRLRPPSGKVVLPGCLRIHSCPVRHTLSTEVLVECVLVVVY